MKTDAEEELSLAEAWLVLNFELLQYRTKTH